MATVKENLIAAKALIDTPEKWGKEEYLDKLSGCMCAYGAIGVTLNTTSWLTAEDSAEASALEDALDECWGRNVAAFNDAPDTTHADIMALFDRAIAACPDP